ncbi:MAG: wax ester/triacylglycerol synthase family O-acyltransferase [Proteobacteria bacterium]|nr:wax ester/triacylglycerol synthase family O-acyltransferase [Pseudomonadota bacterium]
MAYTHYDRLSALDASFLDLESSGVHMHVASVGICEPGPLARPDGGIDFEQILQHTEEGLFRVPRFRQKLQAMPATGHPVWVDDPHFNLLYHVRHTALPLPGDERQLKRLVGRIVSQKLDRTKPMWELWFVEGLVGGRFAVVSKVHHCLIDGISGVDLLAAFMGTDAEQRPEPVDHRWMPRPAPGRLRLLSDAVTRTVSLPARMASGAARSLRRPRRAFEEAAHTASGFAQGLASSLSPAAETPFNVPVGPHRRFDWTRFDLGVVREVKGRLGCTLNDVVLACVTGAVRAFLEGRAGDLGELDFRVFVPVSTRSSAERGKLGNRVSMLVVPLPVGEPDPRRRAGRIRDETAQQKESGQTEGAVLLEAVSDWTSTALLTGMSRLASTRRAYNLVVTNVPGPDRPVYLNGARLLASYPLVPLFENQALGIALFSYADGLYWGFNADWDAVPDLHDFVQAVEREFETLRKL